MNLDLNEELVEPADASENDTSDFEVRTPLTPWEDLDEGIHHDDHDFQLRDASAWNTHGVIHVRLLCAQRLPCPVGSSVCASVSLPPYKGRVKSKRKNAFLVSLDHGVCVQWSQPQIDNDDLHDPHDYEDDGLCSMVNGWSDSDSPIPSIKIDLMFSPLGMGLFDFTMSTVELSCAVLLKAPGEWRERWIQMEIPSTLQSGSGIDNTSSNAYFHRFPLVKIQAVFTPSTPSSGESNVVLFGFGGRVPQYLPPPMNKPTSGTVVVPRKESTPTEVSSNATTADVNGAVPRGGQNQARERRNSDETSSLSNLDVIKSKKILRESKAKQVEGIILEDGDTPEADEDMTSIGMESDFPLDSPISARGIDDGSIVSKSMQTASALEPHLLRADTYWVPGACAVCDRVLIGRNGGFHCEQCNIDCCSDCRLNVDIRVPCGSEAAQEFVDKIQKAKLSFSGLLNYVAPDKAFEQKRIDEESIHHSQHPDREANHKKFETGQANKGTLEDGVEVARFRVDVVKACLFQQNLPAWERIPFGAYNEEPLVTASSLPPVRKGDYYVRISTTASDKTLRTPTLQNTGMPNFQSSEMLFPLFHYGVQFRIDVVEANTDFIVGSALFTTQGLLQEQRDAYVEENGSSIFQFLKGPIPWKGKRELKLELRSGIKPGSIDEFYSNHSKGGSDQAGAISGWVQLNVGVEELNRRLYGSRPIECPNRPPAVLNMGNFSVHIARIKGIIGDANDVVAEYKYVVSWKNPFLTAISMYIFIWFCISFNSEYSGSLPFLFLLLFSAYCAYRRSQGNSKRRFIREELESIQRVEGSSIGYTLHRPKGMLTVAVTKGRSLLSKDLGISGRVSCRVFFDQARYADGKGREKILREDKSAASPLEIGYTPTMNSAYPDWNEMVESTINKRLKQLTPSSDQSFFRQSSQETYDDVSHLQELTFPILQPFEASTSARDEKGRLKDGSLRPWHTSKGAIVITVKFQDFLNNLPGFDHSLGEIVFPFAELVKNRQIEGWFKMMDAGTNVIVPLDDFDLDGEQLDGNSGPPRIHLRMKWTPPSDSFGTDESEKELSYAIQEELVRSSLLLKESKFDLVETSIGAVNTALGIGGTVQVIQNTLGSVLDVLEAVINAFNFTDPFKSSVIFAVLFLVWLVLSLIPTRYIVLAAGLAQYVATFVFRYGKELGIMSTKKPAPTSLESHGKTVNDAKANSTSSPFAVWVSNAIRSLPTNEDLRKAYFWESRRLGAEQAERHASEKRESRLQKLWKAKWYSPVYLLLHDEEGDHLSFYKEPCFAVIQGHRFLWWYSVQDFDNGELPDGELFLSGHAGLGGPSPLEIRELSQDELPLCLSIFGRGIGGQQKVVMILPDASTKENLETVVVESSSFKND